MRKAQVPAISVKNRVFWANRTKGLPFNLKVGKQTAVAVFAAPTPLTPRSTWKLEVMPEHGRTGIVGRTFFRQGNWIYRDIDAKGIGHIDWPSPRSEPVIQLTKPHETAGETYGILDRGTAMREIKTALKFQKAGIRADLPIAGIFIEQIPLHAMKIGPPSRTELTYSKISIKEARKRGLLAKGTGRPVILLRAFGTKFRVMDLAVHDTAREQREMINDAKAVLSRELGRKLTDKEYVEWFATNLGEQIARMHANGWTNQYIDAHNVTLDGRIVDLEGVRKLNSRRARHADEMAAYRCLSSFIGGCKLLGIDTSTSLKERFLVKYHELYDELRKRR